jgi:hypothetical protein
MQQASSKFREIIHLVIRYVMLGAVVYSFNIRVSRGEFPYAEICYIILHYIHLFTRCRDEHE